MIAAPKVGTVSARVRLDEGSDPNILVDIVMATSVHLPKPLLDAVDRRARALKISRNRLIVKALERELSDTTEWPPGFFEQFLETDDATREAAAEMLEHIRKNRSSKGPPKL